MIIMGLRSQLALETGCTEAGINNCSGRVWINKQLILPMAATATGNYETALTAATTTYFAVALLPRSARLKSCYVRSYAVGAASFTFDVLKVADGKVASADGVALITQIAATALVAKTAVKCVPLTAATEIAPLSLIVVKVVSTAVTETAGNIFVSMEFVL